MATFLKNIHVVARSANRYMDIRLAESGAEITGVQAKYLFCACNKPGISQDMMAKELFVNKSNVARQLSALEEGGYIARQKDADDGRILKVFPTEKGERYLPKLREINAEWRALICENFTEEERAELTRLTEKLVENAVARLGEK